MSPGGKSPYKLWVGKLWLHTILDFAATLLVSVMTTQLCHCAQVAINTNEYGCSNKALCMDNEILISYTLICHEIFF